MTRVDSNSAAAFSTANQQSSSGGLTDLDMDGFLRLLISEMQNQDPMNPMDNAQMIEQISQIRSVGATTELSNTLGQLNTNQQLVTASGLIGKSITGLSDTGEVDGIVEKVTVQVDENDQNSRTVKVHVGDRTIDIDNIRQINTPT
jgi:flagellar basal-body rod modification protein FlgD